MRLKFYTESFVRVFLLMICCCLLINCSTEKEAAQTVIVVKVPPFYNEKLSQEENYWRYQKFLFPQIEIPNPIPKVLPNDASVLFVSVNDTGDINLNFETIGDISKTNYLASRLGYIFSEREKNGMYEPGNWKIIKAVGIRTDSSVKYSDFIKVVEAVKQSGAEPIVLLFDDKMKPRPRVDL